MGRWLASYFCCPTPWCRRENSRPLPFPAVSTRAPALRTVAIAGRHKAALRFLRTTGNDVNNAIDGICATQRAAVATDDFYSVDVFQHDELRIPEDAGIEWRIHAITAVDENQQFIANGIVEAARTNGILIIIDFRHLQR